MYHLLKMSNLKKPLYLSAVTGCMLTSPAVQAQTSSDVEMEEIIVTGIATTEKDSLQAVDIIFAEELEAKYDGSIGATLADLPGLSTTNFGPAVGRPVIRGLGGDRVRILTNGIDLLDASTVSTDHALSSEGLAADRIEVLRGAAAIPYGGNAVAGVVNIIDGSIPTVPTEDGVVDGRLYVGTTSVDDGSQLAGRVKTTVGNVILQVEALSREAGDLEIPDFALSDALRAEELAADPDNFDPGPNGVLTNTAFDFEVFGGGASVFGDWGFVGFSARDFEANYGLPLEGEAEVGIAMEQTRIDAIGEINVELGPFSKATFATGYVDYQHAENALDDGGVLAEQTLFENEGYEFRGSLLNGTAGDKWNGSVGITYLLSDFSATGVEDFIPPAETTDWGIYGAQRLDLGLYGVEGGLRIESREVEPIVGPELDFDTVSSSIGAFYRHNDQIFTGISLARTERAPTNAELFSDGFHPATGTFENGNVNLEEETAISIEGVFNYEASNWEFESSLYYTGYSDFIFLADSGEEAISDVDTGELASIFNYLQDDADFYGIEAYARGDVAQFSFADLALDGALEYVRAETDNLGNVPFIPPLSVILGAELEDEKWALRGDVEIVSSASDQAEFELPTDSYVLVDLQARLKPIENHDVTIIVGLDNLFDEEARLNTSQIKDIVPLAGRNLRLSVSYGF